MLMYFRVWEGGSVLMIADSISPVSACAMVELTIAPKRLEGTPQPTRVTS